MCATEVILAKICTKAHLQIPMPLLLLLLWLRLAIRLLGLFLLLLLLLRLVSSHRELVHGWQRVSAIAIVPHGCSVRGPEVVHVLDDCLSDHHGRGRMSHARFVVTRAAGSLSRQGIGSMRLLFPCSYKPVQHKSCV